MTSVFKLTCTIAICVALAALICYLTLNPTQDNPTKIFNNGKTRKGRDKNEGHGKPDTISKRIIRNVKASNIEKNLRQFIVEPHWAGTSANYRVADKIANLWREAGIDNVHFIKYNVMLAYPNLTDPNHIAIFEPDSGKNVFESTGMSPVLIPNEQGAPGAGIQWLAYSPANTVEGDVVYCNRGTKEDFERLNKLGISVEGKIALMRYYKEFRASKIYWAQKYRAMGAILYSDPLDFAPNGTENVYPNSIYLPGHAVQRGTIKMGTGDFQTPLYPSRPDIFRSITIEEAKKNQVLPSIPALPIGYEDAYNIFRRLGGQNAPDEWQGGLNLTYRLGPGFSTKQTNESEKSSVEDIHKLKLRIKVNTKFEVREIRNVVGYLMGATDPDDYVIVGNHYDAWVYGAVDPNSGTATLAEVVRVFGEAARSTGWRPARTIVFCNWDAEEFGMIGSNEFVEDFLNILSARAVAHFNVDSIATNFGFKALGMPLLFEAVMEVARKIANPIADQRKEGIHTLYDIWLKNWPNKDPAFRGLPAFDVPGGSSDHASFINIAGIPSAFFQYYNTTSVIYPLYHTLYDTMYYARNLSAMENFSVHKAMGQFLAELLRKFADDEIIPLNVTTYSHKILNEYLVDLQKELEKFPNLTDANFNGFIEEVNEDPNNYIQPAIHQFNLLKRNAKEFHEVAQKFEKDYVLSRSNILTPSRANNRLKIIERCFINPRGISDDPSKRHVLFSTGAENMYEAKTMYSVYKKIGEFEAQTSAKGKQEVAKELANEISIVQYSIQCAINTLSVSI